MTLLWLFLSLVLALRPQLLFTLRGGGYLLEPHHDRMVRAGGWAGLALVVMLLLFGVLPLPGAAS